MISDIEEKIRNYMINNYWFDYFSIEDEFKSDTKLAKWIAIYAHIFQRRENGEDYFNHPRRVNEKFHNLLGIYDDVYTLDDINQELAKKLGIPFTGVGACCLLHDVIEDTMFSLEDIRFVFSMNDLEFIFDNYIRRPLLLLTHNKKDAYQEYINKILKNKTASLVKMLDLCDNMNLLSLTSLDSKKLKRTLYYAKYVKQINDKYHFIEKFAEYRKEDNNSLNNEK